MGGVVEGAALDIDIGSLLQQRYEPVGGACHPGLGQLLVIERQGEHLKDVAGGTKSGKQIWRSAGAIE